MSFEGFKRKVNALIERAGGGIAVMFATDEELGKHYAVCSGEIMIIGRTSCKRVEVRWGSGHTSLATI